MAEVPAPRDRLGAALAAACALLPAVMAAAAAPNVAAASHDEAVVRAVGWGWTGAFRALDVPVFALLQALPLGTRAFRAALVGALAAGAAGLVAFHLVRGVVRATGAGPRLSAVLSTMAALCAVASAPWQIEARAPAGSAFGAVLALLPLAALVRHDARAPAGLQTLTAVALLVGAAIGYEPAIGVAAAASSAALLALDAARRPAWSRALALRAGAAVLVGAAPFAVALAARRAQGLALASSFAAHPLGERGESPRIGPWLFAREELGWIAVALAVAGVVAVAVSPRARAAGAALLALVVVGAAAIALGAPAGPTRYASCVLAATVACFAFTGAGIARVAQAIAQAPVPFARASAAMVVVLGLALPVKLADEATTRGEERGRGLPALWDEVAWGPLPPGSLLLVHDRRSLARLMASRASGALRPDLAVVPLFDLAGKTASRELVAEPKLAPFWRDLALGMLPEEFSLSSLAQSRALVMPFDVKWDRPLARHLVPVGLVSRYEPEPRGQSDRRKALDAFAADRDRLAKAFATAADPELVAVTAWLLRARLLALASAGEREVITRGLDDLRPFSRDDALAAQVVRRMVISKGVIEVRDLAP